MKVFALAMASVLALMGLIYHLAAWCLEIYREVFYAITRRMYERLKRS